MRLMFVAIERYSHRSPLVRYTIVRHDCGSALKHWKQYHPLYRSLNESYAIPSNLILQILIFWWNSHWKCVFEISVKVEVRLKFMQCLFPVFKLNASMIRNFNRLKNFHVTLKQTIHMKHGRIQTNRTYHLKLKPINSF